MAEVHHGREYVYSFQYHLVWCVKYRHDVLVDQIEADIKTIIQAIMGWASLESKLLCCDGK